MTRRKIAGVILAIATILFIIYCLLFLTQNQNDKIEKGVGKAMENYTENANEQQVKQLTKELNTMVEEKMKGMEKEELSEEQLEQLLTLITKEVNNRIEYLTEKELHLISNKVLKELIAEGLGDTKENEALIKEYKEKIDQLTIRIDKDMEKILKDMESEITQVEKNIGKDIEEVEKEFGDKTGKLEKEIGDKTGKLEKELGEKTGMLEKLFGDKTSLLENEINQLKERITKAEDGGLYYTYEEGNNTLHLHGKR